MMSIFDSHIKGRYGLICPPDTDHSEILYVVIITSSSDAYKSDLNQDKSCSICVVLKSNLQSVALKRLLEAADPRLPVSW